MYAYIKGEIIEVKDDNLIIEANGIGYNVKIPFSVAIQLPNMGSEVKIYTYTCVREDAFILYGFLTRDDLEIFKKLITVNGIGPKGALGILSVMSADDLRFAILSGDAKAISKAPGVGAKSAERIIIDLKDKVSIYADESTGEIVSKSKAKVKAGAGKGKEDAKQESFIQADAEARNDALEALVSLGYSATDALKALKNVGDTTGQNTEYILKAALKALSK